MRLLPVVTTTAATVKRVISLSVFSGSKALAVSMVHNVPTYALSQGEHRSDLVGKTTTRAVSVNSEIAGSFERPKADLVWG